MGYYSNVKLILTDKGMEMLRTKVKKPTEEEPYSMAQPIYEAIKIQDGEYWLIEWEDVKWYDDPEGFKVPWAVLELRNELREIDEPFNFMRVGEDYEDVETDVQYSTELMPYLELKREIEVEY